MTTARRARTIVLEMLGLVPGRIGGMETYARNLVRTLPRLDRETRYVVAVGAEARGLAERAGTPVTELVVDAPLPAAIRRARPLLALVQSAVLARALRRSPPDVMHCTLMFPKPPWRAATMVLTIHDLNFELLPDCWAPLDRTMMRLGSRLGARIAAAITTVSEFSRRTIVDRYGVPPARVHVTPLGVRRETFEPAPTGDPTACALRDRLGLPPEYLLFPANTWPHKNHARLLEALAALRQNTGIRPALILTGAPKHAHAAVTATIGRLGLGDQVRWLGFVDEPTLAGLYRTATALVFPSLHEGFGMPVLEAMASGCPVACSRTTATGELAGDAALTFDPTDTNAIVRAIETVLGNEALRRDLVERGLRRAAEFSWERTARETLGVYAEVEARGG